MLVCSFMSYLLLVRPILEVDLQLLKNEFIYEYHEDDRVLYISIMNDKEKKKNLQFVASHRLCSKSNSFEHNRFKQCLRTRITFVCVFLDLGRHKWLKGFNLTGASSKARDIESLCVSLGEYHPHVQKYIIRTNILEKSNHHLIHQNFPFTTKYSIVQNIKSCQNLQAVQ